MTFTIPERLNLARLPTPLEQLPRTSEFLGIDFLIKRDDLTGAELSGNKVRKLEFLFADAQKQGADTVITCGGEQSNHCRATSLAATRLGMGAVLLLRTQDPTQPPPVQGNILLDQLAGAEIIWISHAQYAQRAQLFAQHAERLRKAGRRPYVIVEGGSDAVGAWGYVEAVRELVADLATLPQKPTTVVYACGSGGTGAGLILGGKLVDGAPQQLSFAGVNVCDDRDYFVRTIKNICAEFEERYRVGVTVDDEDISIIDGYVGLGYARSHEDELREIARMARRDAIIFDPVYTGKAFFALVQELKKNPERFGSRVVFLHTGGIFGLFANAAQLAPLL